MGAVVWATTNRAAWQDAAAHAEQVVREIEYQVGTISDDLSEVGLDCVEPAPVPTLGYAVVRNGAVVCRQWVEGHQLEGARFRQGLTFPASVAGGALVGVVVDGALVVGLVPVGELAISSGAGDRWVLSSGEQESVWPVGTGVGPGPSVPVGDGTATGVVGAGSWQLGALAAAVAVAPAVAVAVLGRRVVTPLRQLADGGGNGTGGCFETGELHARLEQDRRVIDTLRTSLGRQGVELRRQVAVELHDGPVQDLATALLVLELAESQGAGAAELGEVRGCVRQGVEDLRRMCSDLLPVPVAGRGVVRPVSDGAQDVVEGSGMELCVTVEDAEAVDGSVDEAMSEVLVRNCLEAVRNAVRHSGGTSVRVRLWCADGSVLAEVADDGAGMGRGDREAAARAGHLGLCSMAELVDLVGGTVTFTQARPSGTVVRISVPAGQVAS